CLFRSPVPFVAGIHICNLEKAKQHLSAGTRLIDLDMGQISVHEPSSDVLHPEQLDMELGTPKAIFSFLHHQLKEIQRQLNVTINTKKLKNGDWKQVNGEILRCFERLTHPFFELIVNLLGCYTDCLTRDDADAEVDLNALIACQSCPGLESFLKSMFESQTIQLFLDQRSSRPPDQNIDLFESRASQLRGQAKRNIYHYKATVSFGPIFSSSLSNIASHSTKYDMKFGNKKINFGSPEWLRAKKLRNPGRICHTGLPDSVKRVKSESAFNWNILSRKVEHSLSSYKTNKFGSMDIHPTHTRPVMTRMQDVDYSSFRYRPNSCFAHSSPSFASGTLLNRKTFDRHNQGSRLEGQTGDKRSSDSSLKSSSPSNHYNLSDAEFNKPLKREPPPRPPPPHFPPHGDNSLLNNIEHLKSQTLSNRREQSLLLSRNALTDSKINLNRIKSEKDSILSSPTSVFDKTCSLQHTRRKTCPSTDMFPSTAASHPPPLPPRSFPSSSNLHKRSTISLQHLDKYISKPINGYVRNCNMNLSKHNGTSLSRPLEIPIANSSLSSSSSSGRGRYQFSGYHGPLLPTDAPPPLPPRKLNLKIRSELISNSNSCKSILSESNPNLSVAKCTASDNKQLSLCERRAKRFQSLNDKSLQINSIKMTLPLRLTENNNVRSSQMDTSKKQLSHESISKVIEGLSLECQKSNCSTLSQSVSDVHSQSGSYYSIVETKPHQSNVSTKSSTSELLLFPKELSVNDRETGSNSNGGSSGKHRFIVRLKYGTISPQRRSKSITTVPNLTLHRAHTYSPYQLKDNNLFRTKSMNCSTTNSAPTAFIDLHSKEQ
ncbi:DENN domain containing 1A, partial [Schistosoma japonicum]